VYLQVKCYIPESLNSINAYSFSAAYCRYQSSIYAFTNHGDTDPPASPEGEADGGQGAQRELYFLPDRETAIG
jgi:hypothetical protein